MYNSGQIFSRKQRSNESRVGERETKISWSTTSALNLRIMQHVTWFSRNA